MTRFCVQLPLDRDGIPIDVGDELLLAHNGKQVSVRSMELRGDGWIIWPNETGGGVTLPRSAFDVSHVSIPEMEKCAAVDELVGDNRTLSERSASFERLAMDCLRLLFVWDRAEWDSLPDDFHIGGYEPSGNFSVLLERARELGIEVG